MISVSGYIYITKSIYNAINKGKTPKALCKLIKKYEEKIAKILSGKQAEYLQCDEATNILSFFLNKKKITHQTVIGHSDASDSHVWCVVDGQNYDPTYQGYHNGKYEPIELYINGELAIVHY